MNTQHIQPVYIGSYTKRTDPPPAGQRLNYQGRGEGIYLYHLDLNSGALSQQTVLTGVVNPSYLAFHPGRPYLYSVNQAVWLAGEAGGGVSAFAINPDSGQLTFLNRQPSGGGGPCYLSVDQSGGYVLVSNYRTGTVAMLPLERDGRLGPAVDSHQHQGSSINPKRQEGPHAHSFVIDPANRFAFSPDLGLDKIMAYRLDLTGGKLLPHDPPWVAVSPGSGPRHFTFHPDGRFGYVINELGSTITAFTYAAEQGQLTEIETVSTLPAGFNGDNTTADIHLHRSGKFLYGSNRGHNSIAMYAVDEANGRLQLLGHESTQGRTPRNFGLDPSGQFLLAANQDTDNVVVFRIDPHSGRLTPTGHTAAVPSPVCVKML